MPRPIIHEIYDAWEWHLEDDLARLNRKLKVMEAEFKQNNVPHSEYGDFIKQKLYELIRKVDK